MYKILYLCFKSLRIIDLNIDYRAYTVRGHACVIKEVLVFKAEKYKTTK